MATKRLSQEQIDEIIKLYQDGVSPKEIGEKFGIFSNSVTRILRKRNINRTNLVRVTAEIQSQIVEDYKGGSSSTILAQKYNIHSTTILRILSRNGLKTRPPEENKRIYKIDANFFADINNEEKAYFLGFLYADGSVNSSDSSKSSIRLGLHPRDKDVLIKFSNLIYGFTKFKGYINKKSQKVEMVLAAIYSKKMCNDLVKLGCTPNKSFTIAFPTFLREDLVRHFIRGYFDGDGCTCNTNETIPRLDITSTENFLIGLNEYSKKTLGIDFGRLGRRHPDRDTPTRNLQLKRQADVKKFLDFMYKDATVYMDRKYASYKEAVKNINIQFSKKSERIDDPSKYGSTYIPKFNEIQLLGTNVALMSPEQKSAVAEFIFNFYRDGGFPYPALSNNDLIREFNLLKGTDCNTICKDERKLQISNTLGIGIFKHFSPHFYEVNSVDDKRKSMLDSFRDDKILMAVIKNRLNGNFNITGNMIKQGLYNSKLAMRGSIFFPLIAKFIYEKFTSEGDIVYDYSMGFGQRLLGALSLKHNIKYVGVDPWEKSVNSNQLIFDFFNKNVPMLNKTAEIIQDGSEKYCDEKYIGKVKLAFSSPPYFTLENYENDPSQATFNNDYVSFLNEWWRTSVANISKLLAEDGIFALNIKEEYYGFNLAEDMCNVIREAGFNLIDTYYIQSSKNLNFRNKTDKTHKFEPIFIFKK